jgi:nitrite reductase (NADH) small subunit
VSVWQDLGAADELTAGAVRPQMKNGVRLVVGRSDTGFFALDGICPHAGAILGEGTLDGDLLLCPVHAFGFETTTGHCVDDPGCSVRAFETRVRDGRLEALLPSPS